MLRRLARFSVVATAGLGVLLSPGLAAAAPPVPDLGSAVDAYGTYTVEGGCGQTEQPGTARIRNLLAATYPDSSTNILRSCTSRESGHEEGRAVDWMRKASVAAEKAQVEDFLGWLLATDRYGNQHAMARRTGVMYLVWNNKMWRAYRPKDGWQPQTLTVGGVKRDCATLDATYTTACHRDHLHISFTWEGARAETSYFRAPAPQPSPVPAVPTVDAPSGVISGTVATVRLRGLVPGEPASVQTRPYGGNWASATTATPAADGTGSASVPVRVLTDVRVVSGGVVSAADRIQARVFPTLRASSPAAGKVSASVTLNPLLAGVPVRVYRVNADGSRTPLATPVTASGSGVAAATVGARAGSTVKLQALPLAGPQRAGQNGAVVAVAVR